MEAIREETFSASDSLVSVIDVVRIFNSGSVVLVATIGIRISDS
jgi:hypothetical protein